MTDIGEGIAVLADPPPEEEIKKKPISVRVSVFFDGTLNNRVNIEAKEENLDAYIKYHKDGNSYENGRTNIAIMEPHIEERGDDHDICTKSYIEGQGTIDLRGDKFLGYAFAIGKSGVPARAKKGVNRAVSLITNSKKINSEKHFIKKLTLDVFGFSRGAATARYAIHLFLKDKKEPIYSRLQKLGFTIEESAVEVCFAGLYDTVLSYMASQKFDSANNLLQQKAVSLAKKAVHLASAEEHRKDFPLHNINSAKATGGEEFFLPGVHSDVGGSYNKADEKKLKEETDPNKKVYMTTNSENMIINIGSKAEMEEDRDYLVEQGWYISDPNKDQLIPGENEIVIKSRKTLRGGGRIQNITYFLEIHREGIHSAYSNIPLKLMADFARGADSKLKINSKLEDRADIIIEASNLQKLESKIKKYVASKPKSTPSDWLSDASLKEIRGKHLNFSSKIKTGYAPRFSNGKRTRFIYDA